MPTIEDIFNYVFTLRQEIANLKNYNTQAANKVEELMKEIEILKREISTLKAKKEKPN